MGWTAVSQKIGAPVALATTTPLPVTGTVGVGGAVGVQNLAGTQMLNGAAVIGVSTKVVTAASATWEVTAATADVTAATGLVVIVRTTTAAVPYCAQVSGGIGLPDAAPAPLFCAPFGPKLSSRTTASYYQATVPFAPHLESGTKIQIWWSGAAKGTVTVWAVVGQPAIPMRPDGRAYPLGAMRAVVTSSGSLIAAPTSPLRVMVRTLQIAGRGSGASASGGLDIKGTINGATASLVVSVTYGETAVRPVLSIFEQGLLLDAGTEVSFHVLTSATGELAIATYDIVV